MKVIEKVRAMREMHQWTQEDMANKLHMSVTSYAKLERGDRKMTLEELERIATVFSMDLIDLPSVNKQNILCFINSDSNQNINYYATQDNLVEIEKLRTQLNYQAHLLQEKTDFIGQQKQHIQALNALITALEKNAD